MEKTKKTAPLIAHVALLALLCVLSIVSAIIIFTGNIPSGFEASEETYKTTAALYGAAWGRLSRMWHREHKPLSAEGARIRF